MLQSSFQVPDPQDETLKDAASLIPDLLIRSIATNTLKTYAQGFRAWNTWCASHPEVVVLPVEVTHLALFIVSVVQANGRFGKINNTFYAISWLHRTLDYPNPCDSGTILSLKEAAKRLLAGPVTKKDPMTPHMMRKLATHLLFGGLQNLRTLTVCLLSYAGFLRYDEVSRIRRNHIVFKPTHLKVFIDKSKADQHNAGEWVHIARSGRTTCPYKITQLYLRKARPGDTEHIFRGLFKTKEGHKLRRIDKPIGYTTLRTDVLDAIQEIGLKRADFGLHSFRRGGATRAANCGIPDRLFKKHGRWNSENAKDGYVAEDLRTLLSVSKCLGI